MERNRIVMKIESLKALAWVIPLGALVIGGILWFVVGLTAENATAPMEGLEAFGKYLTLGGGGFFAVALLIHWILRANTFIREKHSLSRDSVHMRRKHRGKRHRHRKTRTPE